jgi:SAM-dependent methyltransferase
MKLNLGSADRKFDGYKSVDIVPPADFVCDLSKPWPWEDSSISEVIALNIIEHIEDRIHFINELWRVMKPGAVAVIEVPSAVKGSGFAQDPNHKSMWCLNSFQYFEDGTLAHRRFAKSYGITARFKVRELTERWAKEPTNIELVCYINALLEAVKG